MSNDIYRKVSYKTNIYFFDAQKYKIMHYVFFFVQ